MIPILFVSLLLLNPTEDQSASRWPAFLGHGHSEIRAESIPLNWSPGKNIAWQTKLAGKGQSSPVIWGDVAYVTSIEGSMKEKCHIQAISISDGSIRWTKTIQSEQTIRSNYFQSRSAPTPVVDEHRIVVFFETGNLVSLSHSGEILWERSLVADYGPFESTIGLASSPLQYKDRVILLIDHEGPSYLLAISKKSGETIWKVDRDSRVSYASPALVPIDSKEQVVCSSAGTIEGFDPETGEQLWLFDQVGGNSQNTPIVVEDGLMLIGASPGMHDEREAIARESNLCLSVVKKDGKYQPSVVWQTKTAMTSFASPFAYKGYAYWVTKAGVVYCFDVKTGEEQYKKRLPQQCWATPVGIGDRIYFFGKDGTTAILSTGPEFKVLAENELWDPALSPPTSPGSRGGRSTHEHDKSGDESANNGTRGESQKAERLGDPSAIARRLSKPTQPNPADTAAAENQEIRPRPPQTEAERDAARAQGENRFADPVQYGFAFTEHEIVIRTGEVVYCVR